MTSRRRALGILGAAGAGLFVGAQARAALDLTPRVYTPSLSSYIPTATPTLTATPTQVPVTDAPIVGPASGTTAQAIAWLAARADPEYTDEDIALIVGAYRDIGDSVGMDWFLAIAQNAHETGSMTSFWSKRPQRNPAGLGVTGVSRAADDPPPDTTGWAFNTQRNRWEVGISFATWANDAIPAHLGRLLAYALTDAQANAAQLALIQKALSYRSLSASLRGTAPTIIGLNGRWAVPGTTYGQTIISLRNRIRDGKAFGAPQAPGDEDGDVMPEGA